jgi:deoxyhypusine synthase
MSNFFIKNNLSEIFKDFKNENIKGLPCYHFMPQKDKSFSLTSDIKNTDDQVNHIISILISEENFSISEELENELINSNSTKNKKLKEFCNKLKNELNKN